MFDVPNWGHICKGPAVQLLLDFDAGTSFPFLDSNRNKMFVQLFVIA